MESPEPSRSPGDAAQLKDPTTIAAAMNDVDPRALLNDLRSRLDDARRFL